VHYVRNIKLIKLEMDFNMKALPFNSAHYQSFVNYHNNG
jgi:hypothetical protein